MTRLYAVSVRFADGSEQYIGSVKPEELTGTADRYAGTDTDLIIRLCLFPLPSDRKDPAENGN